MTRFYLAPESEATFRRVSQSRVISHVAKKCVCGKQTTAKALTQYGRCLACQKAAEKRPLTLMLTTSHPDRLLPENSDWCWTALPSTWTKARKV